MIKYLYANNYKSFVNFRIDFDRSNLLIGLNGSGKSNVFILIASIRDLILGDRSVLDNVFSNSTITRWMNSSVQTFELCLSGGDAEFLYKIEIDHDLDNLKSRIASEKLTCEGTLLYQMIDGAAEVYDDNLKKSNVLVDEASSGIAFVPEDRNHRGLSKFKDQIRSIILCTPNPKSMADLVQNDVYLPRIDFSNIASTYAGVVLIDPDIFNSLMDSFKNSSKGFVKSKIFLDKNTNSKRLMLEYSYNGTSCFYFFSELSDGEKMLFALYTLLYAYIKNGMTVLLDEPDNYVSLREIQPWCSNIERELGEEGQCIMISHHPEIIDYMAESDGIWLSRLNSGESKIIDKPEIGKNEELFTYSEMISRGLLDEVE